MASQVKLTLKDGVSPDKEYVFSDRTICTVGRAADCFLQLPADLLHQSISRHHCLLDIDPPSVRVRDLGSRNGTFVNGCKIGQRDKTTRPEEAAVVDMPEFTVEEGDEIKLGEVTVLAVTVC
jgi:pSer/pThr/pTyr-binding forkhead associated (FHA) protein